MLFHDVVAPVIALTPVAGLLIALLYLDSYKLVRLRWVLAVVTGGAAIALLAYVLNAALLDVLQFKRALFAQYLAPVTEELLKGAIIVVLVRSRRIGFLVDAAVFGFATGTGFSIVENLYYLATVPDASIGTWLVRGIGTALMHGGTTAIFAVAGLAWTQRHARFDLFGFVPGAVIAIVLHSGFNHLASWPRVAMLSVVTVLPVVLQIVFDKSDDAVGKWLGPGFDADAEMLDLINSGRFSDSAIGRYLATLKGKFKGPIVADILCYLRLYTELSLRAKGMLLMRENGFEVGLDDETRAKFEEMRYLERSIGRTALLAVHPMLHMSPSELWQVYALEE